MTRRTKRPLYRYHKTDDVWYYKTDDVYRYSYTNRHFLRISRTFVICVIVTCVIFHFSFLISTPRIEKTQESITNRWENNPVILFNRSFSLYNKYTLPPIWHATRAWQSKTFLENFQSGTFETWRRSSIVSCNNSLALYAFLFVRLKDVGVDKRFCIARAEGGEEIHDVFNRAEHAEYYRTEMGCFSLLCPSGIPLGYFRDTRNTVYKWFRSIKALTHVENRTNSDVIRTFTIAIERRDYANMYWSMNDWYTTFLMMRFFNQTATSTNILFVDAHPKSNLDGVWSTLFNSAVRFSKVPQQILFADMVWGLPGYKSALVQVVPTRLTPPFIDDFRTFFLNRYRIEPVRDLDCRILSILFLWRHNYVAHPRNPKGTVQRRIANEEQLISSLRASHPSFKIVGVQMDLLSMINQLRLITQADVVIGMHGAGLAHVLMMQKHSVMIELFPKYSAIRNNHFADLARWRGVSYIKWINIDNQNEMGNFMTHIPVSVMESLLTTAANHMCSGNAKRNSEPLYIVRFIDTKITDRFSKVPFFKQVNVPAPVFRYKKQGIFGQHLQY